MSEKMGKYEMYSKRNTSPMRGSEPKHSGALAGRNEYPLPNAMKIRDEKMRYAEKGKPPEQKFLTDMEA